MYVTEEDNPGRVLLPPASEEVLSAMDYRVAVGIFYDNKNSFITKEGGVGKTWLEGIWALAIC